MDLHSWRPSHSRAERLHGPGVVAGPRILCAGSCVTDEEPEAQRGRLTAQARTALRGAATTRALLLRPAPSRRAQPW